MTVRTLVSATVLLAEDDEPSRGIYCQLLNDEGYRVIEASDGKSALDVLNSEPVDLLVTDIMMPGMTGIELLERARTIRPDLRVIVMTGHKTSEAVIDALRFRACEFLLKPFHTDELAEAVRSVLSWVVGLQIEVISGRPDWIELRVPCDLNAVEPIERFLGHLHEHISKETREAVGSVFREMLTNAVEYGGKCDPSKRVEIKYIHLKRAILYSIKDPGEAFNLAEIEHAVFANPPDQPTRQSEVRQELGLRPSEFGIMLASQVIDELVYNEEHNELIFVKYIDGEPQA